MSEQTLTCLLCGYTGPRAHDCCLRLVPGVEALPVRWDQGPRESGVLRYQATVVARCGHAHYPPGSEGWSEQRSARRCAERLLAALCYGDAEPAHATFAASLRRSLQGFFPDVPWAPSAGA